MIALCREIYNEKEWFPIKKKSKEIFDKFQGIKKFMEESNDDVYSRHRSKFITKLRDFAFTEEENAKKNIKNSGSIGESTDSDTKLRLGNLDKINFDEVNDIKNDDKDNEIKIDIFNQAELQIHNEEDY